jgi:hypothetical protein
VAIGIFIDKNRKPAKTEILEAIGPMISIWQKLIHYIREKHLVQEDFKFMYGKNYGWALRFRIKGKLLVALYPSKSGFTAQVILNPEAIRKSQKIKFGENVRETISQAHPYPEGRWLFIPVKSGKDFRDIQQLLELRVGT